MSKFKEGMIVFVKGTGNLVRLVRQNGRMYVVEPENAIRDALTPDGKRTIVINKELRKATPEEIKQYEREVLEHAI